MLGNWGRLCPFDMIFSANGSVFRSEHDPLLRTAYFLSKMRVLRVRKKGSALKLQARYASLEMSFRSIKGDLRGTVKIGQEAQIIRKYEGI